MEMNPPLQILYYLFCVKLFYSLRIVGGALKPCKIYHMDCIFAGKQST